VSRVRIGTRRSPLALWQAHHVRDLLLARDPGLTVELVEIVTQGDRILDRPLAQVGGKGLFVKEIEDRLLGGEVDLAVHSLKDLPAFLPEGLVLAAIPTREDARDGLISPRHRTLENLPQGARVGTSSLRRGCQLKAIRPDLEIVSIRGNVETRMRKVETDGLDAVVLALAGLNRLGLAQHATDALGPPRMLPAVGQGALALEIRAGDRALAERVGALDHAATHQAIDAERAFLAKLEGNCQVPLAAFAQVEGGQLTLHALVGSVDGKTLLRTERRGLAADAAALGRAAAETLLAQGAAALLAQAR
jgi:hydroxymethylbilane synthase